MTRKHNKLQKIEQTKYDFTQYIIFFLVRIVIWKCVYNTTIWLYSFTQSFWWKLLLIYLVFVFQFHLPMVNNWKQHCYWVRNIDTKRENSIKYKFCHIVSKLLFPWNLKCWFLFAFINTQQLCQNFTLFLSLVLIKVYARVLICSFQKK